jgi:DNA-binding transcriptional LysR family regulator
MKDLDLTTLRLFVAVCETGSLSRAAEQAHIVGSAVSKRLAQLEGSLGTELLVRRRRGVALTPAGATLLEHARSVLAGLDRMGRDMTGYAGGARGLVRVLCTSSVLEESLAQDVADFLRLPAYGDIQVTMEDQSSSRVVSGVLEGTASLGLCWDATDMRGLPSKPYRTDHLAMVMHPTHELASHRELSYAQTLGHAQVGAPAVAVLQILLSRVAAAQGAAIQSRAVVANFDAALRIVNANLAMAVVPVEIARIYAAACGLRVVPLTDAWARRQFVVCFRSEAALSPAASLLLNHLASRSAPD